MQALISKREYLLNLSKSACWAQTAGAGSGQQVRARERRVQPAAGIATLPVH